MNESICPLLTIVADQPCPCRVDCAWYVLTNGCALLTIADHLDRIASVQEEANGI